MDITKQKTGATLELTCTGRLESSTAPLLEAEIKAIAEDITMLRLNLTGVEYVSSAGLRVFLVAQKKMAGRGKMVLTGVNKVVMQVLDMTKMSKVLTIE